MLAYTAKTSSLGWVVGVGKNPTTSPEAFELEDEKHLDTGSTEALN